MENYSLEYHGLPAPNPLFIDSNASAKYEFSGGSGPSPSSPDPGGDRADDSDAEKQRDDPPNEGDPSPESTDSGGGINNDPP